MSYLVLLVVLLFTLKLVAKKSPEYKELRDKIRSDLKILKSMSLLIPLLTVTSCDGHDGTFHQTYEYNIQCTVDMSFFPALVSRETVVNGEHQTCWCGDAPVFIFIAYGDIQYYCLPHTKALFDSIYLGEIQ